MKKLKTVGDLIKDLQKVKNKTHPVIVEYDGMYVPVKNVEGRNLYTEDNMKNITDYEEPMSKQFKGIIIKY